MAVSCIVAACHVYASLGRSPFISPEAELPMTMRFHDLRLSAASLLLAQGVSPKMIADLLGHSRIGITMNLYSRILPAMRRETADAMDQILGSR